MSSNFEVFRDTVKILKIYEASSSQFYVSFIDIVKVA